MKIQPAQLPTIHENQTKLEPSNQEARIEGMTNSEAPCVLHAARMERVIRMTQPVSATKQERIQQPKQQKPLVKAWKNFCHNAAMICGALFLPSFACLAIGLIGLCVPAALLVVAIVLTWLGGKPTPEDEAARQERAIQAAIYDPR